MIRREIELLYIYRFKQAVEENVLKEKINPNTNYSDYVLQKLSNLSKVGVISSSDPNLIKFMGVDHRQLTFGRHMDFLIWVVCLLT